MSVRYWTTYSKGEVNHPNHHAECDGIEFFAFPYQSYTSDSVERYFATISNWSMASKILPPLSNGLQPTVTGWYVNMHYHRPDGTGRSDWIEQKVFEEDKDAAFEWAAAWLNGKRNDEQKGEA